MDTQLAITVLGNPTVTLDGAPVRGFVSNKAAALAYYLAVTGRTHARDTLAALLWPEANTSQASKNLRDVLSNLRRLLEPYFQIDRHTVCFLPDSVECIDAHRFLTLLEAAKHLSPTDASVMLGEAIALYRGDLLEGFFVSDALEFEEWLLVEREHFRQLASETLHRLVVYALDQEDYQTGMHYVCQLLSIDPLREEAHRQHMVLLALSGQRAAALERYEMCRRLLHDEIGIDPDEETTKLHQRILAGDLTGNQVSSVSLVSSVSSTTARAIYHLPALLAPFIGRAQELAYVVERICAPGCRLVTVTGVGGAGKTRLALQAAHDLLPISRQGMIFAHGIAFVALAAIDLSGADELAVEQRAGSALATAVADALHFSFSGREAPQRQLAHYLNEKELLLILDNCEHLPVASFVTELLEQAPGLAIIATSRGRLNVRGEQIVELTGLPYPSRRDIAAHNGWNDYSAVQLFQRTAQAVNPHLVWSPTTTAAVVQICELVAGLPLGIELAAHLVRLMPCEEIAYEIAANLEFLQSARRDLPERHQSLRAVFDHSWNLLNPTEQRALRQLSVFRGGFSRSAAVQVAGAALPTLASLVDNSLVRHITGPSQPVGRYELQELVRQYAAEKFAEASATDEQSTTLDRHCRFYLDFLHRRIADLRGSGQQTALTEIHQEIENIRGAWRYAVACGHIELLAHAADSLFHFIEIRNWFQEGAEIFALAAERLAALHAANASPLTQQVWAALMARQGWFTFLVGRQVEARALLEHSIALLRPLEATAELVFPLNYLAAITGYGGDYAAAARLAEEALQFSRANRDQHGNTVAQTILAQLAYMLGHLDEAWRHALESLAIGRELGNRWGMVFSLLNLGWVAQAQGKHDEAQCFFAEGLAIREALGDKRGIGLCLNHLGDTAEALGDYAAAQKHYQASLALFKEIGNQVSVATSLIKLGYNALALQEQERASAYFHESLRISWNTQALPRTLDALVGIACGLAADQPARANELAILVLYHPASTQESRHQAAAILGQLEPQLAHTCSGTTQRQPEAQPLDAVVAMLLSTV
ncbi:MAG: tetratricopeptide repeat protein [Chloroflexales bacterium]|nr:tetratricopeptide repeat protein [Chloroflexales bacterium]